MASCTGQDSITSRSHRAHAALSGSTAPIRRNRFMCPPPQAYARPLVPSSVLPRSRQRQAHSATAALHGPGTRRCAPSAPWSGRRRRRRCRDPSSPKGAASVSGSSHDVRRRAGEPAAGEPHVISMRRPEGGHLRLHAPHERIRGVGADPVLPGAPDRGAVQARVHAHRDERLVVPATEARDTMVRCDPGDGGAGARSGSRRATLLVLGRCRGQSGSLAAATAGKLRCRTSDSRIAASSPNGRSRNPWSPPPRSFDAVRDVGAGVVGTLEREAVAGRRIAQRAKVEGRHQRRRTRYRASWRSRARAAAWSLRRW